MPPVSILYLETNSLSASTVSKGDHISSIAHLTCKKKKLTTTPLEHQVTINLAAISLKNTSNAINITTTQNPAISAYVLRLTAHTANMLILITPIHNNNR